MTRTESEAYVRDLLSGSDPAAQHRTDDAEAERTLARILASEPSVAKPRRRWTIVLATVFAVGAVGATADAAGIIPSGVFKGLTRADDPGALWGKADTSKARLLVETRGPDGLRVQWWMAPGTKGGMCSYLRWTARGRAEDGSTSCGMATIERYELSFLDVGDGWLGVYGRAAAPATRIRVTFDNGEQRFVPLKPTGYFMTVFADKRLTASTGAAHVAALDANGRVLMARP